MDIWLAPRGSGLDGVEQLQKTFPIKQIRWGESEIGGPRHYFREGMMLRNLKPPFRGHVLDAGCGSGSLTLKLAKLGYVVDAVDLSPSFVDMVSLKAHEAGLDGTVSAQVGNVTNLAFSDGAFDAVLCGEVLEHVGDDEGAVREFARVLKPEGICIVTVPADPRLWTNCDEWAGHCRRYTRDGLEHLFGRSSFEVISTKRWGFPFVQAYDRLVFQRYAAKMMNRTATHRARHWVTRVGNSHLVSQVLGSLFLIDRAFGWCDRGPGLIVVGKVQK
ncbi:MAG: class I SAM-dependent methyltransferase [Chloroflexi bacterium]|nr:class I SAM-dependent methyltransferase [Chloroflexota bacterium]